MADHEDQPVAVLVDREGLGDALLKLPLLRALKHGFPGCPIWWIASHETAMAGTLRPYVDTLIAETREHTQMTDGGAAARAALRALPAFSTVFDTRSRITSVWRARWQLRHRRFYCSLPGYFLSSGRPPGLTKRPDHIGDRAMALARAALGPDADGRGAFPYSDSARAIARDLVPRDRRAIGLAIGSREPRKNWPLERFIELGEAIAARGLSPVFLIGPEEAARRGELESRVASAVCVDLTSIQPVAPVGSLDPVLAVMDTLALVVANDGGLGHLAGTMGRPVVSLFGPTDPARWAPMADPRIVIRAQDHGGAAMDAIPVAPVLTAVERLLSLGRAIS